jgi:glucose 1-dehydrogenase
MQALTVIPNSADSARLEERDEPSLEEGDVLVQTHCIGICGTDREIVEGRYGAAPPGERRLVIGHESIGRVVDAGAANGFSRGDWVVGVVRRPDPVPCANCAAGEWDMCRNGEYTEHGIKGLHGFARERYRIPSHFLVKVEPSLAERGVLLEPTSVVAKAWAHVERIASRATWVPRRVLVTGAGPIGLLAAMLSVQRGLDVHVLDRATDGRKPALTRALGATYHSCAIGEVGGDWDVVFECTGAAPLFFDVLKAAARDGIVCLTGVSSGGRSVSVDAGALNRELVLENNVVFGSVNANLHHYTLAAAALAQADPSWLDGLITRRVPVSNWAEALKPAPDDVKAVLAFV